MLRGVRSSGLDPLAVLFAKAVVGVTHRASGSAAHAYAASLHVPGAAEACMPQRSQSARLAVSHACGNVSGWSLLQHTLEEAAGGGSGFGGGGPQAQ